MKHIFLDFDRTLFDTERFYNELEKGAFINNSAIKDINLDKFLYPDVLSFLQACKEAEWNCFLVTFGDRTVQKVKFKDCNISEYFAGTFYVESGSKVAVIEKAVESNVPHENIYFIDDTIEHLEAFSHVLQEANAIKMSRPGAKGSETKDSRFYTVSNLNQVFDAITG